MADLATDVLVIGSGAGGAVTAAAPTIATGRQRADGSFPVGNRRGTNTARSPKATHPVQPRDETRRAPGRAPDRASMA